MTKVLLEHEGRAMLEAAGLTNVPGQFYATRNDLIGAAHTLNYPVVLKIVSPDVIHKSDFGGVRLNIKNATSLLLEYDEMIESIYGQVQNVRITGVLVTEQVTAQAEIIVGSTTDPQFGPVIMVGLGGIFVEIFKDLSFGIAPIDHQEARSMLQSLKALPILEGSRGRKPVNMDALVDLVVKVSELVMEHNIAEMDMNPIFCVDDDILVGDVRIMMN